jgi:hypothetical protein
MKSTRLTKEMKRAITEKILVDAYKGRIDALENDRLDFSEVVYKDIYKKDLPQMDALPSGWLPESCEFMVQFGSQQTGFCRRMLREPKRFLGSDKKSHRQCLKIYDDNHKFTKIHDELTERKELGKQEYSASKREIISILDSCSTTKQAKEAWPEIEKYIENFEPVKERITQIVPIMGDLNERLGLVAKKDNKK